MADHFGAAETLLVIGAGIVVLLLGVIFGPMRTAVRRREAQLRRSEAQLRQFIDAAPVALAMFDRDMRYLAVSQRFRDDYSLGGREIIGRSHFAVFPDLGETEWPERYRRCLAGAVARAEEEKFIRPNGQVDWLRWEIRPWYDASGAVGGVILFVENITPRKRAEQALGDSERMLRQAQRMEALGQLTGGVAHDFNNLLGVIIGNAEFLLDAANGDTALTELANQILQTAMGGAELVRRLLAFARRQPLEPQVIDLNTHLPAHAALLQRTLGETIHLSTALARDLWLTRADPSQIADALLNLAINARDAMPEGGDLTIETANVRLDEAYAARHEEVTPGEYVLLAVTDTGIGMSPETIERAMEPFFTTKAPGLGTGLGLSMIYGFTKQSQGHLKIYSELGFGTTVKLYLPRVQVPGAVAVPAAPASLPRGSEAILLVDDNAEVRKLAALHLTSLGYTVHATENGPAALAMLQTGIAVDLLFSDLIMPEGMTGYQLAEAAQALRPGLKVLFTTGYARVQGRGDDPGAQDAAPIIRKPYRRQELAVKIREALGENG